MRCWRGAASSSHGTESVGGFFLLLPPPPPPPPREPSSPTSWTATHPRCRLRRCSRMLPASPPPLIPLDRAPLLLRRRRVSQILVEWGSSGAQPPGPGQPPPRSILPSRGARERRSRRTVCVWWPTFNPPPPMQCVTGLARVPPAGGT